jgi:hypothetical protein
MILLQDSAERPNAPESVRKHGRDFLTRQRTKQGETRDPNGPARMAL